jgi:amino acid permease
MSTDSYQLLGMAERGFIPEAFARRSKHGTPTLAIIFSSLGIMTMARYNSLVFYV